MSAREPAQVFTSFDGPETAARATKGEVREIQGIEPGKAFVVTDAQGRKLVYVHADWKRYRSLADRMTEKGLSEKGEHADHVASRAVAAKQGQTFVLLGRVDGAANVSASGLERVKPGQARLDRAFNKEASKGYYADGESLAEAMSMRQSQKLQGKRRAAYDRADMARHDPFADPAIAHALFQDEADQKRIAAMEGKVIARVQPAPKARPDWHEASNVKGPWDQRAAPGPSDGPSAPKKR